jgi:hypothetical protein
MEFRSPYKAPWRPPFRECWSEWQDLSFGLLSIEFAGILEPIRGPCVLSLCTQGKTDGIKGQ